MTFWMETEVTELRILLLPVWWRRWWRLESVWVIFCLFLQIHSVCPPIVHPMTIAMLYVNSFPLLWLPSESGQLAASQTDVSKEGQRSHGCGCLLYLPGRLAKDSLWYSIGSAYHSALLGSETLHFPHLFRRRKGENASTSAQVSLASPSRCLCERRTSVLASLPPCLQSHCRGWLEGGPAVDWTECRRWEDKGRGSTEDGGAVGLDATRSPKWVSRSNRVFTSYSSVWPGCDLQQSLWKHL